jgi:hypothetical protein
MREKIKAVFLRFDEEVFTAVDQEGREHPKSDEESFRKFLDNRTWK